MSEAEVQILDAVDPQGCGLRVEFFRVGPRWAHRLLAVEDQAIRPLLESVEGDQQQFFPPSPALQQLAFQQQDDGVTVALLIGMAGKNHWSVGVEAFAEQRRVRFDVACRNQPCSVGQLGSAYHTLVTWQLAEVEFPVAVTEGFRYELAPQVVERGGQLDVIGPSADPITLRVAIDRSTPTQRWCYEFQQSRS